MKPRERAHGIKSAGESHDIGKGGISHEYYGRDGRSPVQFGEPGR